MTPQSPLQPGTTTTATFEVKDTDLASVISPEPGDNFPKVLATSRLVAYMEIACARILQHHLSQGQLSVGVALDVLHSAPTPIGASVTIVATFSRMEGKLYVFDVKARDAGGSVGEATHTRAMVDSERLELKAQQRTMQSGGL